MAYGGIWENKDCPQSRDISSECGQSEETENHTLCFNDGNETHPITSDRTIFLPRGEIGVIGCVNNPIIPLINLNLRRRDIDLRPGEFARIRCGGNTLDVVCGSDKRFLRTNISLFPTEYVLVTCNITRN